MKKILLLTMTISLNQVKSISLLKKAPHLLTFEMAQKIKQFHDWKELKQDVLAELDTDIAILNSSSIKNIEKFFKLSNELNSKKRSTRILDDIFNIETTRQNLYREESLKILDQINSLPSYMMPLEGEAEKLQKQYFLALNKERESGRSKKNISPEVKSLEEQLDIEYNKAADARKKKHKELTQALHEARVKENVIRETEIGKKALQDLELEKARLQMELQGALEKEKQDPVLQAINTKMNKLNHATWQNIADSKKINDYQKYLELD